MTKRDIIDDLAALTHPPVRGQAGDDPDAVDAANDQASEDRARYDENLRLLWEAVDDYDPLLSELAAARETMLQAERRMRQLIAYGREFVGPRPYTLDDLARAAGMSISGVRTAYDDDEIATVARLTGAKLRRRSEEPS